MELIGALAVIFLYWCVVHFCVTGRWAYVSLAVWSMPCIGAAYFAPQGAEINGLVMLICFIAMFTESLAYMGVKMWNVNARRTKRYIMGIFYFISLLFVCVVDRFFSNKKDFVIIRCETFIAGTLGKFDENLLKNRYLCGINNGKEYYFGITDKAYILLKDVSTCRLKLKKGVLGGLYITKYPEGMDERLAKNADRWLFKKGLMGTIIFGLVFAAVIIF